MKVRHVTGHHHWVKLPVESGLELRFCPHVSQLPFWILWHLGVYFASDCRECLAKSRRHLPIVVLCKCQREDCKCNLIDTLSVGRTAETPTSEQKSSSGAKEARISTMNLQFPLAQCINMTWLVRICTCSSSTSWMIIPDPQAKHNHNLTTTNLFLMGYSQIVSSLDQPGHTCQCHCWSHNQSPITESHGTQLIYFSTLHRTLLRRLVWKTNTHVGLYCKATFGGTAKQHIAFTLFKQDSKVKVKSSFKTASQPASQPTANC